MLTRDQIALLIMALLMIISSISLYSYGRKKRVANIGFWSLIPLFRGLHWFTEFLDEQDIFSQELMDKTELILVFISSFILIGVILEFSGLLKSPHGMIAIISGLLVTLVSITLMSYKIFLTIDDTTIEFMDYLENSSEESGFVIETDPFRITYGLIIPLFCFILLRLGFSRVKNTSASSIEYENTKVTFVLQLFLIIFSIVEGIDFDAKEDASQIFFVLSDFYQILRSITLFGFVLIPLLLIITTDLGLQKIIIISEHGLPIYAYDFTLMNQISDNSIILTSGFVTALLGLSEEISTGSNEITMYSNNLYYTVRKVKDLIFVLQSITTSDLLESHLSDIITQYNDLAIDFRGNKVTEEQAEAITNRLMAIFQDIS